MAVYRIAGVDFSICPPDEATRLLMQPWQVETDVWDAELTLTEAHPLTQISRELLSRFEGVYIHGAAIRFRDRAYLFCAPSGTGKSTHIALWKQLLGDGVQIINGDKPVLRYVEGEVRVFGTPWKGKEGWGENTSAVLGGIFFLERGEKNALEKLPVTEGLQRFLGATLYPRDADRMTKLLGLFQKLSCPMGRLTCRPDTGAVQTVLEFLKKEEVL